MALDRIGDVEQILKISIAWMGELPQRAPDQHSRRTGKPPPLLPTAETPKKATKLGLHFFAGFSNKQLINSDLYRCKP